MSRIYQFDAYDAYKAMQARFSSFLQDAFRLRQGPLADALRERWSAGSEGDLRLFAPLLVQGAFPFRPGATLDELTSLSTEAPTYERPLHPKATALLKAAGLTYPLYTHQVEAIREASQDKCVILSAGTGSGKTEAFLIPLINRLYWDHERGLDDLSQPGIRAIIIYPLNALVNNQIDRIRGILCQQASLGGEKLRITFAYYTSRLKNARQQALKALRTQGRGDPPDCEIVDRASLRGLAGDKPWVNGPPHILVTNFSMLEYMLIRPLDRTLFLPRHTHYKGRARMRTLVLDEAHVYAGAQAAEIHMLLRRATRRFNTRFEDIQGFATSATLVQGEEGVDPTEVLNTYAGDMFARPHSDIAALEGHRHLPDECDPAPRATPLTDPLGLPPEPIIPLDLQTLEYPDGPPTLLEDRGRVKGVVKVCMALGLAPEGSLDDLPESAQSHPALALHHLLGRSATFVDLRQWLFQRGDALPTLDEVAQQLYGVGHPQDAHLRASEAILRLGSLARHDAGQLPLIPTRMHVFVRSPSGIWVDPREADEAALAEGAWPFTRLRATPPSEGADGTPWLPLMLCQTCSTPALAAFIRTSEADEWGDVEIKLSSVGGDGDPRVLLIPHPEGEETLPASWGGHRAHRIDADRERWDLKPRGGCLTCGEGDKPFKLLRYSSKAAPAALLGALYPKLGAYPERPGEEPRPGEGRRALTFSDSRQGAAEMAVRIEDTHDIGLNRQILMRHLEEDEPTLISKLIDKLEDSPHLRQRAFATEIPSELEGSLARSSVYEEIARPASRGQNLEGMGLVEICYPNLPKRPPELTLFTDDQWASYLCTVLDEIRRLCAIRSPSLDPRAKEMGLNERYRHFFGRTLIWSRNPDQEKDEEEASDERPPGCGYAVFNATRGKFRIRHYTERVIRALGAEGQVSTETLMRKVWDVLESAAGQKRPKWIERKEVANAEGKGLILQLEELQVARRVGPSYIEPKTGMLYHRSLEGVCPLPEERPPLRPLTEGERSWWRGRQSISRILDDPLLGLWTIEHTAQIDVEALEQDEQAFRKGYRNLLASSTTLEMGIDLGGLTFVMLTNVPPGPANYWQRAGRAGRRADGSSMVLTLAHDQPHDEKVFRNPRAFLGSKVVPPQVRMDTPYLLQRHVNALLLSAFFDEAVVPKPVGNPSNAFGSVQSVMVDPAYGSPDISHSLRMRLLEGEGETLADLFLRWLGEVEEGHPLGPVLSDLVKGSALANHPARELALSCARSFEAAYEEVTWDLHVMQVQRDKEKGKGAGKADTSFLRALDHQERSLLLETLIRALATAGYLPRLGFPVDVVRLNTEWEFKRRKGDEDREEISLHPDLRMERQLRIALKEYAPGAEVVAGKRVFQVGGLERDWLGEQPGTVSILHYSECLRCGHLTVRRAHINDCGVCHHKTEEHETFISNQKEKEKKKKRDRRLLRSGESASAQPDDAAEISLPSPVRRYLEPRGFAVPLGRRPRRLSGSPKRVQSAEVKILASNERLQEVIPGALATGFVPDAKMFVRSEGRGSETDYGYGFVVCQTCGYSEPESSWDKKLSQSYRTHARLRGGGKCPGPDRHWRHAVLATTVTVDAFRIRLLGALKPAFTTVSEAEGFYLTLANLLKHAAAELLQLDTREIQATVGTFHARDGEGVGASSRGFEALLYDESCSGLLDHLIENVQELMARTLDLLGPEGEAELIKFDTQFLFSSDALRLPELRQHFLGPAGRSTHLTKGSRLDTLDVNLATGAALRTQAIQLMEPQHLSVALQAPSLADDAFEAGGLMRSLKLRVVAGLPGRLLLDTLPQAEGAIDLSALAHQLARFIEDGGEVRQTAAVDAGRVHQSPWRVLGQSPGLFTALGTVDEQRLEEPEARGIGAPALGTRWSEGGLPVRAKRDSAQLAWIGHNELWERGRPILPTELTASTGNRVRVCSVPQGSTEPELTGAAILERMLSDLGPLEDLGDVVALAYVDRYVVRSAIALHTLDAILSKFRYGQGARAEVIHLSPKPDPHLMSQPKPNDLLGTRDHPYNLTESPSIALQRWCVNRLQPKVKLNFKAVSWGMRHPRKLLIRFAPGGKISTLKVLFEHGLDWARPVLGPEPWPQRPRRSTETFVVAHLNHDLELEKDEHGQSEWVRIFGRG